MDNCIFDSNLLELDGLDKIIREQRDESKYVYNGKSVPRVTRVISCNENSEGLIKWAASMGYKRYNYYHDRALEIGTAVHSSIDEYLSNKYINHSNEIYKVPYELYDNDLRSSIYNAYENFKLWDNRLESMNSPIQEVVGLEIPLVCPWFGGTCDAIFKINNAYYIIDFKTSKEISFNYLVQASAYMWVINNGYAPNLPNIDGIGIIRVDKKDVGVYNDIFLNNFITEQRLIIENLQKTFSAYISSYYMGANANYNVGKYSDSYNPIDFFRRN